MDGVAAIQFNEMDQADWELKEYWMLNVECWISNHLSASLSFRYLTVGVDGFRFGFGFPIAD